MGQEHTFCFRKNTPITTIFYCEVTELLKKSVFIILFLVIVRVEKVLSWGKKVHF